MAITAFGGLSFNNFTCSRLQLFFDTALIENSMVLQKSEMGIFLHVWSGMHVIYFLKCPKFPVQLHRWMSLVNNSPESWTAALLCLALSSLLSHHIVFSIFPIFSSSKTTTLFSYGQVYFDKHGWKVNILRLKAGPAPYLTFKSINQPLLTRVELGFVFVRLSGSAVDWEGVRQAQTGHFLSM